jgi:peptide deformylase
MAILPIIEIPHPLLKKQTKKVTNFGKEAQDTIKNLKDTLVSAKKPEGAGLSANQIGVSKSICVVRDFYTDPNDPDEIKPELFNETVLINPKILSTSKETEIDWEGCLSVPDRYGKVSRPIKIKIKYQDETGKERKLNTKGFFARVIQHEIDHLNGVLFTEKLIGKTVPGDYFASEEDR